MEGYYLFRGNLLIAYNEAKIASAGGLHQQGREGDILIFLDTVHIYAFAWQRIAGFGSSWGTKTRQKTDKYRLLVLLQK